MKLKKFNQFINEEISEFDLAKKSGLTADKIEASYVDDHSKDPNCIGWKDAIQNNTIKEFIDAGGDVNFDHGYPLRMAAHLNNINAVKFLVEHGANIKTRRFLVFASAANNEDILNYLVKSLKGKLNSEEEKYLFTDFDNAVGQTRMGKIEFFMDTSGVRDAKSKVSKLKELIS